MNAIMTIRPWKQGSTWVFDDQNVELNREPFVCGMNEIIDHIVKDIPKAQKGVNLLFSADKFPSSQGHLTLLRPEGGGNWYRDSVTDLEGWLCPALFKYFPQAPKKIYYQATA